MSASFLASRSLYVCTEELVVVTAWLAGVGETAAGAGVGVLTGAGAGVGAGAGTGAKIGAGTGVTGAIVGIGISAGGDATLVICMIVGCSIGVGVTIGDGFAIGAGDTAPMKSFVRS